MEIYSIDFRLGQALVKADSAETAKSYALTEWGAINGPYKVTKATKADLEWVKSMGGQVHDTAH